MPSMVPCRMRHSVVSCRIPSRPLEQARPRVASLRLSTWFLTTDPSFPFSLLSSHLQQRPLPVYRTEREVNRETHHARYPRGLPSYLTCSQFSVCTGVPQDSYRIEAIIQTAKAGTRHWLEEQSSLVSGRMTVFCSMSWQLVAPVNTAEPR